MADKEKNYFKDSMEKCRCELLSKEAVYALDHPVNLGNWRLADKLFHIMSDPFSRNQFERHDHILSEFVQYFHEGFFVRDMHTLTNIVATLFERCKIHSASIDHIICILNLFGNTRPRTEGKSDEIECILPTSNFLSLLGYYLLSEQKFKTLLILTLSSFSVQLKRDKKYEYTVFPDGTDPCKSKPVTDAFIVTIFEDSSLCDSLIQTLRNDKGNEYAFVVDIMNILTNMAEMSSKNCGRILQVKGPQVICEFMNEVPDAQLCDRVRFWALEILWHLIKKMPEETSKMLAANDCIKSLRDAFFSTLSETAGKRTKELRNDFLLLFLLILQNSPEKNVLPPLFIKELAILATIPEVRQHHSLLAHLKLEDSWEDFEMKEFLLSILKLICGRDDYVAFLNPKKLIASLLVHLHPLSLSAEKQNTSFISQKKTLQTLALQILSYYAPEFLRIFLDYSAESLIVRQILWCFSEDILTQKRFIYERDVYLRFCLQILVKIIGIRNPEVIKSLIQLNTVEHMLKILNDTLDMPYEAPYIDYVVKIQSLSYLILAWLCDPAGDPAVVTIGNEGEDIVIKYLRRLNTQENCALPGHNLLLTAVLNCVRCCVIGIPLIEESFKKKNGIACLMDLLLDSHNAIQDLILACLVDFCASTDSAQNVLKWRGPNSLTTPKLLCRLWREEEVRLGIKRDENTAKSAHFGIKQFFGTGKLLVGRRQIQVSGIPMPSFRCSAAILDVSENFRAKIFGLMQYIKDQGKLNEPPPELAKLPLDEMATLAIIEGYLDVKGGEVWTELLAELTCEKFDPLPLEQEFIYSVSRLITSRVSSIMGFQRQCKHLIHDRERNEAINYYQHFYEWKSQEKLLITKTYRYLTKTSNAQALRLIKEIDALELALEQHKTMIKKLESLKPEKEKKSFHPRY